MAGIEGGKNGGRADDPTDAECRDRQKPDHDDRTKQSSDPVRAELLNDEQHDQNRDRDRDDVGAEQRRHDFEPFDRAEHRNGWRNHAVAVQQRGSEYPERNQQWPAYRKPRRAAWRRRFGWAPAR